MKTDEQAKVIWNYMHVNSSLHRSDAIFVLCSLDTRVANRAAELFNQGYGQWVIVSGGLGKLTKDIFTKSEAEVFAEILQKAGVPRDKIIIEAKSTNTGENIRFTYDLLQQLGHAFTSFILVQKPYMERRTYATFKKQWPDPKTEISVTSPDMKYDDYFNADIPKDMVINLMVGDLQRIKEYPKLGYQIHQAIPDDVWAAYEYLVAQGYTKNLIQTGV